MARFVTVVTKTLLVSVVLALIGATVFIAGVYLTILGVYLVVQYPNYCCWENWLILVWSLIAIGGAACLVQLIKKYW